MSLDAQGQERLIYLLTVFAEDKMSKAEIDELNRLLVTEPAARAMYFSDIGLQLELKDQPLASSISQELRLQERPQRHSTKRRRRKPVKREMSVLPWMAAAIAAVLCFVVYNFQAQFKRGDKRRTCSRLCAVA